MMTSGLKMITRILEQTIREKLNTGKAIVLVGAILGLTIF
jgi:hypothetical protein